MSTITQYVNHVQLIDRIVKGKTEGLTHADSMKQLPFPANCMNWNIGHILVYRMQYLGVIDGSSEPNPDEFAIYGAGSDPLTDSDRAIPLDTLIERLEGASQMVIEALEKMPSEKFAEIYDAEKGTTVDDRLQFYMIFRHGSSGASLIFTI